MLLIATDEAGYGPKLGPLVIGATTWTLPTEADSADDLADLFAAMRVKRVIRGCNVVVDDSKAIFKPASTRSAKHQASSVDPLIGLHTIVSAANFWSNSDASNLRDWIREFASQDCSALQSTSWLSDIPKVDFLDGSEVKEAVTEWSSSGIQLQEATARIISASEFNQSCSKGLNKADILSESTLRLVHSAINKHSDKTLARIFCDRHGGRRYYAGVLQHVFAEANVSVIEETKARSAYRMTHADYEATIEFTVKGDRFTPVALSSIYAKYLRERMMQTFNLFFAKHHKQDAPLKPTAGYPTDAERFLRDIDPIIKAKRIPRDELIRQR